MFGVAVAVDIAVVAFVSKTFSSTSSISLLLISLYDFYHDCKFFKIT